MMIFMVSIPIADGVVGTDGIAGTVGILMQELVLAAHSIIHGAGIAGTDLIAGMHGTIRSMVVVLVSITGATPMYTALHHGVMVITTIL